MKLRPRDFFDAAYHVFERARTDGEAHAQNYSMAGTTMRLETASAEMSWRLGRALTHLVLPNELEADFTVCAWDATATPMLSPPWSEADYGARGEIQGFNTAPFRTAFDHATTSFNMIDEERRLALFWTRNAAALPSYAAASPLRIILSWWSEICDCVLIHGGAVGHETGGILLAGAGGSGKSTTALLCLQAGWKYLADDYCILNPAAPFRVFSLYNSAKIDQQLLRDVRPLKALKQSKPLMHGDKELLFLDETHRDQIARTADCRMLLLPRVTGQNQTTIEPASPGEALRALAPTSLFQLAGAGAAAFARLSRLVQQIPIRRLNLGADFEHIPAALQRCLSE